MPKEKNTHAWQQDEPEVYTMTREYYVVQKLFDAFMTMIIPIGLFALIIFITKIIVNYIHATA